MTTYYNEQNNQLAKVNSSKADKDGNIWVEIDGKAPVPMNYDDFIKNSRTMSNEFSRKAR